MFDRPLCRQVSLKGLVVFLSCVGLACSVFQFSRGNDLLLIAGLEALILLAGFGVGFLLYGIRGAVLTGLILPALFCWALLVRVHIVLNGQRKARVNRIQSVPNKLPKLSTLPGHTP